MTYSTINTIQTLQAEIGNQEQILKGHKTMNNWARACVDRLTDNYEWQETIDAEDWEQIQRLMADAINANEHLAKLLINACSDSGVIEDDYFTFTG